MQARLGNVLDEQDTG